MTIYDMCNQLRKLIQRHGIEEVSYFKIIIRTTQLIITTRELKNNSEHLNYYDDG